MSQNCFSTTLALSLLAFSVVAIGDVSQHFVPIYTMRSRIKNHKHYKNTMNNGGFTATAILR